MGQGSSKTSSYYPRIVTWNTIHSKILLLITLWWLSHILHRSIYTDYVAHLIQWYSFYSFFHLRSITTTKSYKKICHGLSCIFMFYATNFITSVQSLNSRQLLVFLFLLPLYNKKKHRNKTLHDNSKGQPDILWAIGHSGEYHWSPIKPFIFSFNIQTDINMCIHNIYTQIHNTYILIFLHK